MSKLLINVLATLRIEKKLPHFGKVHLSDSSSRSAPNGELRTFLRFGSPTLTPPPRQHCIRGPQVNAKKKKGKKINETLFTGLELIPGFSKSVRYIISKAIH